MGCTVVVPPSLVDADHLILDETSAKDAWEVQVVSAFMGICFCMTGSAKHVLGDIRSPKVT